jgi:unsaturated chondroitin disaccharide hydrolase
LEFLETVRDAELKPLGGRMELVAVMQRAAVATADFYLENSCRDGVPMWDTGAPNLCRLPKDYLDMPSDPRNPYEPLDSSAAAIAAQGFIRLGNCLLARGQKKDGARYRQAGLAIARTLFDEPYLSTNPKHQGLLLHSVYHRPNGWDYIAPGQKIPNGESSMWGDYHARELALLILREARGESYLTFFDYVTAPGRTRQTVG